MGRASHNCQHAAAVSQLHRSAAWGSRGRTVVQPRVCFRKLKFGQEIVRSSDSSRGSPGDLVVEWRLRTLSTLTSWRISALARCPSWSTHPDQYSGEVPPDLAWSEQAIGARVFPWHAHVADQWTRQPQLPAGAGDQPRPAVGCSRVSGTDGGPAEGLFEETEGVVNGEAPQVPAPQCAQVGR